MEYPLSAKSSRKLRPQNSFSKVGQRSACQAQPPPQVDRKLYENILKGQKIFIQIYYQGIVMPTAYNDWVSVLGGMLFKRLNPRISICLTNAEGPQLNGLLDRIRKACPQCKVLNILWFEQCYTEQRKVPFQKYELDKPKQLQKGRKQQKKLVITGQFLSFVKQICEDFEVEFKNQLKLNKNQFFNYPSKGKIPSIQNGQIQIFKAGEIFLNPTQKIKKQKDDQNKKRRKSQPREKKIKEKKDPQNNDQTTSLIVNNNQNQPKNAQLCEIIEQQHIQETNKIKNKAERQSLNDLMKKYLAQSKQKSITIQSLKLSPQFKQVIIEKQKQQQITNGKLSINKSSIKTQGARIKIMPRYSFGKQKSQSKQKQDYNYTKQLLHIKNIFQNTNGNELVVISNSKAVQSRIQVINQNSKMHSDSLKLVFVKFQSFFNLLTLSPPKINAYYLLRVQRGIERALYFILLLLGAPPILVSYNLVQQVAQYNQRLFLRTNQNKATPYKQKIQKIISIRKLRFTVDFQKIRSKRIVFLSSQLPVQHQKSILTGLKATWVSPSDYLLKDVDIAVTNKLGISTKGYISISQSQFWCSIFKIDEIHP